MWGHEHGARVNSLLGYHIGIFTFLDNTKTSGTGARKFSNSGEVVATFGHNKSI
jgi:hypothetical protein